MTQSNKPSIGQMNEAIALFDDWQQIKCEDSSLYKKDSKVYLLNDFKYHTSWDRLMPVIEKISALDGGKYNVHISSAGQWACYISRDDVFGDDITSFGGFEPVIINAWKAVYTFIQWYNQQSKINERKKANN